MKAIVVGGQTRNIGKTSVAVGLIRAFSHLNWTAVKITQYGHGICSRNGRRCDCAPGEHSFAISEETDSVGRADTCRFLAAGARRSLWVRVRQGELAQAIPALKSELRSEELVLIESNSILEFLDPLVYLIVLDSSKEDIKASSRRFLTRADVLVPVGGETLSIREFDADSLSNKPSFPMAPPVYTSDDLTRFIGRRLRSAIDKPVGHAILGM